MVKHINNVNIAEIHPSSKKHVIKPKIIIIKFYWFNLSLPPLVPDYIYGVLIGLTKQILYFWLSGKYYKEPSFIGHKFKSIDKHL